MTPTQLRLARLSDEVAVTGVGETDYIADYAASRAGQQAATDCYGLGALALGRALRDAGIDKSEVDGLITGAPLVYERAAEQYGIEPRWGSSADAVNAVVQAVTAIANGFAETVAIVYGNDQRSVGTAYGGPNAMGGGAFLNYVYYAPWGYTSQGGLYAMMTQRYMQLYGVSSADLGQIAVAQRQHASLNPGAIMRTPITIDDYLSARFITEPLRLYDYCLINDGGVAMILTTKERAAKSPRPVVTIKAVAKADENVDATSMRPRLMNFYHQAHHRVRDDIYNVAGIGPADIDVLGVYDSFSCHILFALEGLGFCAEGEAPAFIRKTGIGPGGGLPVNPHGGHLSHSYMQGWAHQVEMVRQARGEAGERQRPGARHVQYISDVAGKAVSIIYGGTR
jgi:acetyl-CoA acetyltransferase